jgi:signal transduction histidine kinase
MSTPGRALVKARNWGRWALLHRYHLLFGSALLFLALLNAWWAVFLKQSVEQARNDRYHLLQLRLQVYSSVLGGMEDASQIAGQIPADEGIAVVACDSVGFGLSFVLNPAHPGLCVAPRDELLSRIERDYRSKNVMVLGEAALAVVLVFVAAFMFYRLLSAEKRAVAELQDMWSRVTHELKTPITGIKALLQTLQSHEMSRQEVEPLLAMALREADRQERLAENLLIGQRLARGAYAMKPVAVAIVRCVSEYRSRMDLAIPRERTTLACDCPEDTTVMADPTGLTVVLDNLVDNAVKYGGESLRIDLRVEKQGGKVLVTVADNGPGFPPAFAEAIFDAYRRLDREMPSGRRGTGMGLAISRALAREMGGNLTAASQGEGKGARFTLAFWDAGAP